MLRNKLAVMAALAAALVSTTALARVTSFEILSEKPIFDGKSFGKVGTYERIDAKASFAVDPKSPRLSGIVGLDKAPTNKAGEVEFSTEVSILRPVDAAHRSGLMLYEVANRGRNLSFMLLNLSGTVGIPATAADAGDGFLMERGDTVVWSGWQTDLAPDLLNLDLPKLPDVTGISREQFIFDKPGATGKGTLTYPAASMDPAGAKLTVREKEGDAPTTPEGLSFKFVSPTEIEIDRPANMDAGAIYEFVYTAKDAVPSGLAFVATSDVNSFLRGNPGHDAKSPLSGIQHTVALGISQSGRFLRDLIYNGFNADEKGAKVFDGAMAHIAGSRKTFTNYAFAQPGRFSRQHEDHDFPGDQFPFTYAKTTDALTGKAGSILDKCEANDTCPKIMHTDTSTEFWQARASLVSTSTDDKPLTMPDNVRLYFIAGAPHFNSWSTTSKKDPVCTYTTNPLSAAPIMRALYVAMADWVGSGKAPPASRYPSLTDGTLEPLADFKMTKLDGAAPTPAYNHLNVMDYAKNPPVRGKEYPAFVPKLDANGNPEGGVDLPFVAAPLGTYAGWNLRADGYAEGELCSLSGLFVPFAKTGDADGRKPLKDRYADEAAYIDAVKKASETLVDEKLMLPGDMDLVLARAKEDGGKLLH